MKKTILAVSLSLACALAAHAQKQETRVSTATSSQTSAAVNQAGKSINLDSGTRLSGELQNSIDVRKARVGDQVLLKTTQAIKSGGRTVVSKGSRLVGHITEVAQKGKDNNESRLGILFDRLEQGTLAVPIAATITSVTNSRTSATANNQDVFASDMSTTATTRGNSSASGGGNGGLLGGAGSVVNSTTSTVGNVVGGTTSAAGTTVDATTNAAGRTASRVGNSLRGVQISESSSTSVEGSSVLSLQGGNLRLEQGTSFNLVLTQSASAGTTKTP
jgi:hypothetical protein